MGLGATRSAAPEANRRERRPSGGADRRFRPDVEGLRAVAILLVVVYHAGVHAVSGGFVGVDVFFVLSGFLITGLLVRERETTGRTSLGSFYARRARRILPASALVLVSTVIASYALLGSVRALPIARDARWAALFAANFRFALQGTNYLASQAAPSPLQHFWSLAVEEQFYLVWPALLCVVALVPGRVRLRTRLAVTLASITVASFAWCVIETPQVATWAYFSPLTRAWELSVGGLASVAAPALRRVRPRLGSALSYAGLAGIVSAALWFTPRTEFPGYAAALPVLATAAAVCGGTICGGGGAETMLRRRPFQRLGKLSYSLYLWHWPVLIIAMERTGHELGMGVNLALVGVSIVLSELTYRIVENPVRRAARLVGSVRRSLALGGGLIATAAVAANLVVTAVVSPAAATTVQGPAVRPAPSGPVTSADVVAAVRAAVGVKRIPVGVAPPVADAATDTGPASREGCEDDFTDASLPAPGDCYYGDRSARRLVVLFGDSHAAMWVPAFDDMGARDHFRVLLLSKPACPAPYVTMWSPQLERPNSECNVYRARAINRIRALHPFLVVTTSNFSSVALARNGSPTTAGLGSAWNAGLAELLTRLAHTAGRVDVLGDIPAMTASTPDCLAAHPDRVLSCDTPTAVGVQRWHNAAEARIAAAAGDRYVNVVPWMCTAATCPVVIHGDIVYFNQWHITATYARWLQDPLAKALGI